MLTLNTQQYNYIASLITKTKPVITATLNGNHIDFQYIFDFSTMKLIFKNQVTIISMGEYQHTPFKTELIPAICKTQLISNNINFDDAYINGKKIVSMTYVFMDINGQVAQNIFLILQKLTQFLHTKTNGLSLPEINILISNSLPDLVNSHQLIIK